MKAGARLAVVLATVVTGAQAYSHFTHFASRTGPFTPILEKFDLNVLPGKTLGYYVADPGVVKYATNDSFPALLSQIRSAAKVWNDIESSDLRILFGGMITERIPQGTPSVEVLFEEVPPGIVAMGGPTVRAESNGVFVPIVKSVVILQPDLTNRPIYTENFSSTLIHEFGHALGLQHTFTSSVMSTATTRATSKARPLTTDDVAAISILYPKSSFLQNTGSITGQITMNGQGVNLASVVAIAANGAAVSALTNPDGTYRIDGLPPRGYYVYVHPLPPPRQGQTTPGDIVYPVDNEGQPIPESPPFETVFFSSATANGVKDPGIATQVSATAGVVTENISFTVRQRNGYGIHSVETYAYPGEIGIKPPYLSPGMARPFVIATGSGLINGTNPVPGLTVSVLGGASLAVQSLSTAPANWLQILFNPQNLLVSSDSARHLVFSANNDIYVLPSAFFHVERQPPQILGAATAADSRTVEILSAGVTSTTRYLFDGVPAQVRSYEEIPGGSRAIVVPPQAAPGYRAIVTALNSDGQSSLFLQRENPPSYVYSSDASIAASSLTLAPNSVPSGVESMVQIDALNGQFIDGQISVSFGSADVSVRRLWVINPSRLLVNVTVSPTAQLSTPTVTIISGLQVLQQAASFVVQGTVSRPFWLNSVYLNAISGQTSVSAGSTVTMLVGASPVTLTTANASVMVNDIRVPLSSVSGNQITFQLPPGLPAGPAAIRIEAGGDRSLPIVIPLDQPVARILAVTSAVSDLVALSVTGMTDEKVSVSAGGKACRVISAIPDGDRYTVIFQLPEGSKAGDTVPVTVTTAAGTSDPISLKIGG